jgi:hypothetical protein
MPSFAAIRGERSQAGEPNRNVQTGVAGGTVGQVRSRQPFRAPLGAEFVQIDSCEIVGPVDRRRVFVRVAQAACNWWRAVVASMPAIQPATEWPIASG